MNQRLQEYVDSSGAALRVNAEQGVIRGVKILGLESRNGRRYLPQALATARGLYEGAKVNVNHLPQPSTVGRDYRDRIGVIREVMYREAEGLFGDLHFNPKHLLAAQLIWDAEHAPQNVGFSHNVRARLKQMTGEVVVEEILAVESVDLVADPATTSGLFESESSVTAPRDQTEPLLLSQATLADVILLRPDLYDELRAKLAHGLKESTAARSHEDLAASVRALQLEESRLLRQQQIRRLLAEHDLPAADAGDPAARSIVSERLVAELMEADSEQQMRQLVAQRAELVRQVRQWTEASRGPRSIEQSEVRESLEQVCNAAEFARAIS